MSPAVWLALGVGVAATTEDIARRQISNWITVSAVLGGIAVQTMERGWAGLGAALLGTVVGFAVFLVLFLLGGMGGGDVKLMAGFGSILGWWGILEAALWTAGVGGVLAILYVVWDTIANLMRRGKGQKRATTHIPYAPAITLGAWLAMVPKS